MSGSEAIAPLTRRVTMLLARMPHVIIVREESFQRPFDARGLLEFYAVRALPGVEVVDTEKLLYRRTIDLAARSPVGGEAGADKGVLQVGFGGGRRVKVEVLAVRGAPLAPEVEDTISSGVRRLFNLDANPDRIVATLAAAPEFGGEGASLAGVRVPGAWNRFETAVRAVLGQQISVAGARTLAGRLVAALGDELPATLRKPGLERTFPTPEQIAAFDLRTIGLTAARARTLQAMASEVATGALRLDAEPAEVRERLLAIKGIGPWTVEYIAMRALGDPDAFPASDLGLLKAVSSEQPVNAAELEAMAANWRPVRAYAAILLWRRAGGG